MAKVDNQPRETAVYAGETGRERVLTPVPLAGTAIVVSMKDPVSETARWTAASRARENARPDRLFADPLAEHLAKPEGLAMLERASEWTGGDNPYLPIRTRWVDDRATEALGQGGIRQVVFLAAGFDTRPFRLDWPSDVVVYELDRPDLLAVKQATLHEVGAAARCARRVVGVDLAGDWAGALRSAGHRGDQATLWIAEGLLVYLPESAAMTALSTAAGLSSPGSALLCDLVGEGMARAPYTQEHLRMLAANGTPWQFFTSDPEATLSATGWTPAWIDEMGSETADFGRWTYPRLPDPVPESLRELARDLPRTYLVRAVRS